MKKYIVATIGGIIVGVAVVVACMTIADLTYTHNKVEAKSPAETTRTVDKGIETKEETAIETELETEQSIPETEAVAVVKYFDVPLTEDVQNHIFEECEKYGINPAIVVAMSFVETRYNANAIGDNGNSFGLIQVQPKWHKARMERLGCTDLLDAKQNITVAVDYLAEMMNRYGSIDKALTAYNRGRYSGTINEYAKSVLQKADDLTA